MDAESHRMSAQTARFARDAAQAARHGRDAAWPPPVEVDEDAFAPVDEDRRFDRGAMWVVLLVVATASALAGAVLERAWG